MIAECFDQLGAGFVLFPVGLKFPPIHDGWQLPENAHTFSQAQERVAKSGNVGMPSLGWICHTTTWELLVEGLGIRKGH